MALWTEDDLVTAAPSERSLAAWSLAAWSPAQVLLLYPPHPHPTPPSPYPTMAAVGRVLCCGCVEALVDRVTSLPPFSQSKGSFSVMIRSFMLFSNTDMSSCTR